MPKLASINCSSNNAMRDVVGVTLKNYSSKESLYTVSHVALVCSL